MSSSKIKFIAYFDFIRILRGEYMKNNLSELLPNKCAIVSELDDRLQSGMRRRLQDIGLINGTIVQCVQKSPANDPIAYLIRGAVFALRRDDAVFVRIQEVTD